MTLEGAIHARWAADSPLATALPVARLFTGEARGNPALPYAALERGDEKTLARTNSGARVEEVAFVFHVWTSDIEAGKAIAAAIERVFDQAAFTFTGGAVLDLRRTSAKEESQPDGTWLFVCEYSALVKI